MTKDSLGLLDCIAIAASALALGLVIGTYHGASSEVERFQNEAVKKGHAVYVEYNGNINFIWYRKGDTVVGTVPEIVQLPQGN